MYKSIKIVSNEEPMYFLPLNIKIWFSNKLISYLHMINYSHPFKKTCLIIKATLSNISNQYLHVHNDYNLCFTFRYYFQSVFLILLTYSAVRMR